MGQDGQVVFPCVPAGTITWSRDATLNDSDKSFTVPDGHVWQLLMIYTQITATATAGNRLLCASISNGTNELWSAVRSGNITAGQVASQVISPGNNSTAATSARTNLDGSNANAASTIDGSLPNPTFLPAGYIIRVRDTAAIDAAADDMTVDLYYIDYTVAQ